jgi:aminoglycoside phosphotransferase
LAGDVLQALVGVPCVGAQQVEGLVDADVAGVGDRSAGLFDEDAAVQRCLQLLGQARCGTR